jgi:hypothetical protein
MSLRRDGNYWFGTSAEDVWDYFVWWTRNSPEPVKHWQQAVCPCGNATFFVMGDDEEGQHQRACTACDARTVFFAREWSKPKKWRDDLPDYECVCFGSEFEVVGVTAPFMGDDHSAKWFYLGLRCIECGCLGCYADWIPRYNDAKAYLAML